MYIFRYTFDQRIEHTLAIHFSPIIAVIVACIITSCSPRRIKYAPVHPVDYDIHIHQQIHSGLAVLPVWGRRALRFESDLSRILNPSSHSLLVLPARRNGSSPCCWITSVQPGTWVPSSAAQ